MHISISFNQDLNTTIAFAKYPPFSLDIFGSLVFLNSSATNCRLTVTVNFSCLVLYTGRTVFGIALPSKLFTHDLQCLICLSDVSLSDVSDLEIPDKSTVVGHSLT